MSPTTANESATDGTRSIADEPPAELRFRRRVRMGPAVRELWQARELIRTLTERQLRARYKQAFLGVAWAVLTPLVYAVVFTLFFSRVSEVDTNGVPYALFAYVALVPWTFLSSSVSQGAISLVQNNALLNKVRCPREVFPLASVAGAAIDSLVACGMLVVLMIATGEPPRATTLWVPVILSVIVTFAVAVALVLSALTVYLRDLAHIVPLALQVGLFATPVAYGIEVVPARLRPLYAVVNPMAPAIDGLRRSIFEGEAPRLGLLALSGASASVLLFAGFKLFKRMETGFADVS